MRLKGSTQCWSCVKTGHPHAEFLCQRNLALFCLRCELVDIKSKNWPCAQSIRKPTVRPPAYNAGTSRYGNPSLIFCSGCRWLTGTAWPAANDKQYSEVLLAVWCQWQSLFDWTFKGFFCLIYAERLYFDSFFLFVLILRIFFLPGKRSVWIPKFAIIGYPVWRINESFIIIRSIFWNNKKKFGLWISAAE